MSWRSTPGSLLRSLGHSASPLVKMVAISGGGDAAARHLQKLREFCGVHFWKEGSSTGELPVGCRPPAKFSRGACTERWNSCASPLKLSRGALKPDLQGPLACRRQDRESKWMGWNGLAIWMSTVLTVRMQVLYLAGSLEGTD